MLLVASLEVTEGTGEKTELPQPCRRKSSCSAVSLSDCFLRSFWFYVMSKFFFGGGHLLFLETRSLHSPMEELRADQGTHCLLDRLTRMEATRDSMRRYPTLQRSFLQRVDLFGPGC